jgi:hypothetical protein
VRSTAHNFSPSAYFPLLEPSPIALLWFIQPRATCKEQEKYRHLEVRVSTLIKYSPYAPQKYTYPWLAFRLN